MRGRGLASAASTGLFLIFMTASKTWSASMDGGWSPWSKLLTPCQVSETDSRTVECGGGMRIKYRSCTMPVPSGGGAPCPGAATKFEPCNSHHCQLKHDEITPMWSEWSQCSKICGRGEQTRHSMCGIKRSKYSYKDGSGVSPPTSGGETTTTMDPAETTTTATTTTPAPTTTPSPVPSGSVIGTDDEIGYEERCKLNQYQEETRPCNTWNITTCPSPCDRVKCPRFAKCEDVSNATDPLYECNCKLGTIKKADMTACIAPLPPSPTPRPYPSLPTPQKTAATIITRGASLVLIVFLCVTLALFALARIWDSSRLIHFNMEISLLAAHLCLLPANVHESAEGSCRFLSILIHFFFVACFTFMFLEALHLYSLVGWVVKKDGLLSGSQNTVIGWLVAIIIVMFNVCFEYENYGGGYHCWLRMDTGLMYGQYVPIALMTIVALAIIEAAGDAADYEKLDEVDEKQRTSAKVMQRTLIFILPTVLLSFILGSLAEYEQSLALYSFFTLVNGILGAMVFLCHCMANTTIRDKLRKIGHRMCPNKVKAGE